MVLSQIDVRKGMPPVKLTRGEFEKRYRSRFLDPVFRPLVSELNAIIDAAWDAYSNSRNILGATWGLHLGATPETSGVQ